MTDDQQDLTRAVPTGLGELQVRTVGSGSPVVLWHSLFVDSRTWHRLLLPLATAHRVISIDGPGHGGSAPARGRFTMAECAAAAADVLDHLGRSDPVHWIGNAWGGHVGIELACAQPDRIRSLVCIGTPVRALSSAERRHIVPMVHTFRVLGPIGPLINGVQHALLGPGPDPEDAELVASALRAADRRGLYQVMQSVMLHRTSLLPLLPAITARTLFITADQDPMGNVEESREAAQQLRHGASTTIPGSGHVSPLLQQAPKLLELLTDFWRQPTLAAAPVASHTGSPGTTDAAG